LKIKEIYSLYNHKVETYDEVYDFMKGWMAYAKNARTYNFRRKILDDFEMRFTQEISTKEVNRNLPKRKKK